MPNEEHPGSRKPKEPGFWETFKREFKKAIEPIPPRAGQEQVSSTPSQPDNSQLNPRQWIDNALQEIRAREFEEKERLIREEEERKRQVVAQTVAAKLHQFNQEKGGFESWIRDQDFWYSTGLSDFLREVRDDIWKVGTINFGRVNSNLSTGNTYPALQLSYRFPGLTPIWDEHKVESTGFVGGDWGGRGSSTTRVPYNTGLSFLDTLEHSIIIANEHHDNTEHRLLVVSRFQHPFERNERWPKDEVVEAGYPDTATFSERAKSEVVSAVAGLIHNNWLPTQAEAYWEEKITEQARLGKIRPNPSERDQFFRYRVALFGQQM